MLDGIQTHLFYLAQCQASYTFQVIIMRVNQQAVEESTSTYSDVEDGENWRENRAAVS